MILKGSQRGNGADLAVHLMNSFDNESVEIAEVYGTVAGDLYGAFAEFEAVALGTRATEYLYSLSINPPAPLTREQYHEAIAAIEHRLGLTDQPRAVVFHVKEGREHCHVVWSRIDIENMRAIHMAHDRRKLMDLACELARKYGLELPPGLKAWEAKQKHEKERLEPTLGEKAQAEATGVTPEQRRAEITAAYEASDSAEAFRAALEQKGYVLARGDKRGLIVVDQFGGVHSLTRYIKGHKAGDIKKKLAPLRLDQLPTVDQAKEMMHQRAQAHEERQREQQQEEYGQEREREQERLAERRRQAEEALGEKQGARRLELTQAEQELLTRQQAEKLALHAAQKSESRGILFRVRSAVADLIMRTPALRSVLAHIQKLTHLDPKERHALERDAIARRHAREKLEIERRRRMLARLERREKHRWKRRCGANSGLKRWRGWRGSVPRHRPAWRTTKPCRISTTPPAIWASGSTGSSTRANCAKISMMRRNSLRAETIQAAAMMALPQTGTPVPTMAMMTMTAGPHAATGAAAATAIAGTRTDRGKPALKYGGC